MPHLATHQITNLFLIEIIEYKYRAVTNLQALSIRAWPPLLLSWENHIEEEEKFHLQGDDPKTVAVTPIRKVVYPITLPFKLDHSISELHQINIDYSMKQVHTNQQFPIQNYDIRLWFNTLWLWMLVNESSNWHPKNFSKLKKQTNESRKTWTMVWHTVWYLIHFAARHTYENNK